MMNLIWINGNVHSADLWGFIGKAIPLDMWCVSGESNDGFSLDDFTIEGSQGCV